MSSSCYLCFLLLISFLQFYLSTQNSNHVLCNDVERQALLNFKHSLIDPANKLASWDGVDKECCSWTGIVCDNVTGHVHQIHLPGVDGHCQNIRYYTAEEEYDVTTGKKYHEALKQMLGGDLSPSLLHLKQLTHLDLSCNDFKGIQVPSFIGSFRNLRYLNLSSSRFNGIIPSQLGNLSKLHVLDLGSLYEYNDDSDEYEYTSMLNMQWLSSLTSLHYLDMSGVDLSKAIDWFQVINALPSLAELHLSGCQLSHTHPHVPTLNLTSLSLLDLSGNYFYNTSVPRWIFSITSLVSLDLSGCNFQGSTPSSLDSFRNMTSLKLLDVSGNDFMNSSLVLKGLSSSIGSNLISLGIGSCGISSSGLVALHNLTSLLSLDLSHNQLTKAIPKLLGNLCNLREIDLSVNHFDNISLTYFLESFLECKSPSLESLFIPSSGLSSHLPDRLGQLNHLVYLDLGYNDLGGIIPDSIGQLSFLRVLQLSMNRVSGPLPYSIGRLLSLEILDLSYNQMNDSLPDSLGRLPKLERLDLSFNELNGSVPDSLGQLSKLIRLDLSFNSFTGVMKEVHFTKLTRLKYLNGIGNNITFRPQLVNWIPPFQLEYLYLYSWGLGPEFPLWLHLQRDLIELDISNTNISAPLPHSFWSSFPNLTYLVMSENHIQGTLFSIPATLDKLDLRSNKLTGQLPSLLNGSGPHFLDLSNNFFVGSLHHLLCPNEERFVTVLDLGNNNLSGVIPECWVKWPRLWFLNLGNNNLSGEIPKTLGFSSHLMSLNMRGNKLSGRLPDSLMNLTNLLFLQLGRNELVGFIPTWLGTRISDLSSLDLRSNNFHGNVPQELCYLSAIQILDLADNNLSGNIPRCFNNFSTLSGKRVPEDVHVGRRSYGEFGYSESLVMKGREDTYKSILSLVMLIDLSSNNLVGHIPSELTVLRGLKSLNLSRNQLTGRIPEKIGDMKSIESIDLSLNKLSGELPMSLSSLSFLSNLNVSNNRFTGRIPSGTQLQGFDESSFFGNNLCGDPLTKQCVVEVPHGHREEEEEDDGADWGLIISMVLGLVVGFWMIVGPLMISRSWRIAYFGLLMRLRYMAYDVMHKCCCNMFPK